MKRLVLLSQRRRARASRSGVGSSLGNFTINRFSRIEAAGRDLRALRPRSRRDSDSAGKIDAQLYARVIARGALLTVNGRRAVESREIALGTRPVRAA